MRTAFRSRKITAEDVATKLEHMSIEEVSLVDVAANLAPGWLLAKALKAEVTQAAADTDKDPRPSSDLPKWVDDIRNKVHNVPAPAGNKVSKELVAANVNRPPEPEPPHQLSRAEVCAQVAAWGEEMEEIVMEYIGTARKHRARQPA